MPKTFRSEGMGGKTGCDSSGAARAHTKKWWVGLKFFIRLPIQPSPLKPGPP